ncbi:hypothetical protein BGZ63DRAFT_416340 [Mariannaea sp. PMI_226]|nr:hypothetical protein BGZ63DRAFT_416340 [Mariannaea sp. PMI_226]
MKCTDLQIHKEVGWLYKTAFLYCPTGDDSYRFSVPEAAANSESGDIYVQIKPSTKSQWAAVGIGPRRATDYIEPKFSAHDGIHILGGSRSKNGEMFSNIRHSLQFDFPYVPFSNSGNPFTSGSNRTNESSSGSDSDSGNLSGGFSDGVISFSGCNNIIALVCAHGIITTTDFVIAYPFGAILMPIIGNWLVHAGWQFLAFLFTWAGFGIGYMLGSGIMNTRTKVGTIVVGLIGIPPIFGCAHHLYFVKHQQQGLISHVTSGIAAPSLLLALATVGLACDLGTRRLPLSLCIMLLSDVVAIAFSSVILFSSMRKKKKPFSK